MTTPKPDDHGRWPRVLPVPDLPASAGGHHQLEYRDDRYNYWLSHVQFHLVPNFTSVGFEKRRMPPGVHKRLAEALHRYNETTPVEDDPVNIINTDNLNPGLTATWSLNDAIQKELLTLHEAWAGVALEPTAAYGLRVYRDGCTLLRHVDRIETHIISSILHVDRNQSAPWPLVIEDVHGREHAVELEPGELLFYESAKLPHARPTRFRGSYFSSLFVHYRPLGWDLTIDDVTKHIPSDWDDGAISGSDPGPKEAARQADSQMSSHGEL